MAAEVATEKEGFMQEITKTDPEDQTKHRQIPTKPRQSGFTHMEWVKTIK